MIFHSVKSLILSVSKPIKRPPSAPKSVDDVVRCDGPATSVLCVRDGVTDNVDQEVLEYSASLLVYQPREAFHSTAACETTDGWTGDPFDVVTQNFAMAFGPSFAEPLSTFALSKRVHFVFGGFFHASNGLLCEIYVFFMILKYKSF